MTDIILKQGTGVPSDTDVDVAEVAIDTSSGAMYTKLADGSVKHLNPDGGGSGGASSWNDLTDKPAEFPPEAHTHEIADVDGLQDALDAAGESLWEQNGDDIYYNDGNVGIGTDSPSGVPGTLLELSKSGSTRLNISASDSSYSAVDFSDTSDDGAGRLEYYHIIDAMRFWTNNEERMRIDSQGNVGIGTDSPSEKLDVDGFIVSENATNGFRASAVPGGAYCSQFSSSLNQATTTVETLIDSVAETGWSSDIVFRTQQLSGSISERMRIDSDGNVGIGTDSPGSTLHVKKAGTSGNPATLIVQRDPGPGGIDGHAVEIRLAPTQYPNDEGSTARWSGIRSINRGSGNATDLAFLTNAPSEDPAEHMRIDYQGRVGIGGEPGTRSIDEAKALAKTKLTEWKAEVKKRTAEQPEASTQEITLEVTDGDFGVMPTEQVLAEFLQERNIGGGNAKLQVAGSISVNDSVHRPNQSGITFSTNYWIARDMGNSMSNGVVDLGSSSFKFRDAHFSGTVNAGGRTSLSGGAIYDNAANGNNVGIRFGGSHSILGTDGNGDAVDGDVSLGATSFRFKNAYFSGTIYGKVDDVPDHVKAITPTQIANWDAGTGGGGGATTDGRISDDQIVHWDQAYSWGNHASAGYQPAGNYLTPSSLNGYATESWVTSNYQPAGNYLTSIASGNGTKVTGNKVEMSGSYTGTFTATGDIVAYSDVRLKEKIRTLDGSKVFDMRGVSFERDGKPSSGVIAQELQEIAPELVHDDGEHLGVAYGNLVGYLIEAVKELKAEVEELKRG